MAFSSLLVFFYYYNSTYSNLLVIDLHTHCQEVLMRKIANWLDTLQHRKYLCSITHSQ